LRSHLDGHRNALWVPGLPGILGCSNLSFGALKMEV
jgi:hypothetical protein